MIIIEGPDNSGKSTLANDLSSQLRMPVLSSIRPPADATLWAKVYHGHDQLHPQRGIRDRLYAISEYVYGRVLRGGSEIGDRHSEVMMDLLSRPYPIIYCRPSLEFIKDNHRPQMPGVMENIERIVFEYDYVMNFLMQHMKVIIYNPEVDTLNNVLSSGLFPYIQEDEAKSIMAKYMTIVRGDKA